MNRQPIRNQFGDAWTTEKFIQKSKELFGEKYNYDKVHYKNNSTKIVLTCDIHGDFETNPSVHLKSPTGCAKCSKLRTAEKLKMTLPTFLEKAKKKHGDKYDYSDVIIDINTKKVLIHCDCGNSFLQDYGGHIGGKGCPECGLTKAAQSQFCTKEMFVEKAINIHGDKFDYNISDYKNSNTEIEIFCTKHESHFHQLPVVHLLCTHCCPICLKENKNAYVSWSEASWCKNQNNRVSKLYSYVVRTESVGFIKIGITHESIDDRISKMLKQLNCYKKVIVEKLKVLESLDANEIFRLEQKSKIDLEDFRYKSPFKFNGHTECYKIVPEVLEYINSL